MNAKPKNFPQVNDSSKNQIPKTKTNAGARLIKG